MWVWTVVAVIAIVVILGFWVANSARLAKKNKNLARRSPTMFGSGGPEVDEHNRTRPDDGRSAAG